MPYAAVVTRGTKVPVTPGNLYFPFLGVWTFRAVSIDAADFDPKSDVVAGALDLPDGLETFAGGQILYDRQQWFLRPGDLVSVNLRTDELPPGFYVPIDIISQKNDKHYVFATTSDSGDGTVSRIEVQVSDGPGTLKQIAAPQLSAGMSLVVGGVHYIQDGEQVRAQVVEVSQ